MKNKLIIAAVNIHQGGGRAILETILQSCPSDLDVLAFLDKRMSVTGNISKRLKLIYINPTIFSRLYAELLFFKNSEAGDVTLFLGNLPPLLKLKSKVFVYLQNRYLVDRISLKHFSLIRRLQIKIEAAWLLLMRDNSEFFLDQTKSMSSLLAKIVPEKKIDLLPVMSDSRKYNKKILQSGNLDSIFIYVASGEPHKNHKMLLDAWCLLSNEGIFPTLKLTIDSQSFKELCALIESKKNLFNLKIANLGWLSEPEVRKNYTSSSALIFPSTFESFGLPLIEARYAGLPILASELDFVRDLVDPEETFDPKSATSIARAVKRFMQVDSEHRILFSADQLIRKVMESNS
jgi:glycosyltransferase involved in cell wall biosynthesis